jgi:large subunit ribosomal protein L30e
MTDIARSLRVAVTTGEVKFGFTQAARAVKGKHAKLIVVAANCPPDHRDALKATGAKVHEFAGTNFDLGAVCGKPFAVSALAVLKPGESDILSVA